MITRLECAERLEDLQAIIEWLRDHYRVHDMLYHWVCSTGAQYGCGTLDHGWFARYVDKGYLRTDPVVIGCSQRSGPVDWRGLDWSGKAARAFLRDAMAHGMGQQGYSIPIRGPNGQFALFTISDSRSDEEWSLFTERHRRDLILLAHTFNQTALMLEPERTPEVTQPLSPREVETMTLLAVGHSRAQIADMLSISEHTLRVYIEGARFKLGAMNTIHAVARAMTRGQIVVCGVSQRDTAGPAHSR